MVEPVQGMIDEKPELGILWSLRGLIPQTVAPQFVGTCAERIVEHVDSSPELLPDDCFPGDIHVEPPVDFGYRFQHKRIRSVPGAFPPPSLSPPGARLRG